MSNPSTRKYCVVPKCTSTTTKMPEKLFFLVPMNLKIRKKWLNAMKRLDPFGEKSKVYCCEDHFDIENDMENYIKYKLVGGRISLKKGVVPHKFKCQQKNKDEPKRSAVKKHDQIKYFEKLLNKDEIPTLDEKTEKHEILLACCPDETGLEDRLSFANNNQPLEISKKNKYTEGCMSDLDLVIIGADEAENKRQGRAKSFLVACADRATPDDMPHRWLCVGRVSTGLTYDERERLCSALEKEWSPYKTIPPPSSLVFNREKPDFWLLPERSIVLQVRATELIRSHTFGTTHTLRFPRITNIRDDKPEKDIMTLDEFEQLIGNHGPVVKLSTRQINEDQISDVGMKTRRKRAATVPQVAEQFKITKRDAPVVSNALSEREIVILSDDEDCKKFELMKIVQSHGGRVSANIGVHTWCCVAGRVTIRVRAVIESREADVATTAWLRSLPPSKTQYALRPLDLLGTKVITKMTLARYYDCFGDSYSEMSDVDTLKRCFRKMDEVEPEIYLTPQEMLNLDAEIFENNNPFSYLRPCYLYFVNNDSINALRARLFGATLCEMDSDKLTHVIVPKNKKSTEVKSTSKRDGLWLVVTEEWIEKCISESKLVPEHNFIIPIE